MKRFISAGVVLAVMAATASAHFIYIVPQANNKIQVVFSDSFAPDEGVDIAKIAGLKLFVRAEGKKDAELKHEKGEHCLTAALPAGPCVVFGSVEYGILQRGDAKPFQLVYHPKAIVGSIEKSAKIGAPLPVELIPIVEGSSVRFQVVAEGKPVVKAEVTVMVPGKKGSEKVVTDAKGETPPFDAQGRYGAWVKHSVAASGDKDGKKFDEVRHYATLVCEIK